MIINKTKIRELTEFTGEKNFTLKIAGNYIQLITLTLIRETIDISEVTADTHSA